MVKAFGGIVAFRADNSSFDDSTANLGADSSQSAIVALDSRLDSKDVRDRFFAAPVKGVYDLVPEDLVEGDRYILRTEPGVIKTIEGINEDFPNGAIVEITSDTSPSRSLKNNQGVLEVRDYFKRKKIIPEGERINFHLRENGDSSDGLSAETAFSNWGELILHLLNNYIIDTDNCYIYPEKDKTYNIAGSKGVLLNIEGRGKITIIGNNNSIVNITDSTNNTTTVSQGNEGVAWEIHKLSFDTTYIFRDFKSLTFINCLPPKEFYNCTVNFRKCFKGFLTITDSNITLSSNYFDHLYIYNSDVYLVRYSYLNKLGNKRLGEIKNCNIFVSDGISFDAYDDTSPRLSQRQDDFNSPSNFFLKITDSIFFKSYPTNSTVLGFTSNSKGKYLFYCENCVNRTLTPFSEFMADESKSFFFNCLEKDSTRINDFDDTTTGIGVSSKQQAIEALVTRDRTFTSNPLSYINNTNLVFPHKFPEFDSVNDFYQIQVRAVCTSPENGWTVGERIKITSGYTESIDATNIYVQISSGGACAYKKDGKSTDFNLTPSNWQIYVTAVSRS